MLTRKLTLLILATVVPMDCLRAQEISVSAARQAMHSAVEFFRTNASYRGAYVYRLSSDLKLREGEGKAKRTTGWTQPPGTPAVGLAYLQAYQLCHDPVLLEAARETADALIRGQLASGGWSDAVQYAPQDRKGYAFRVDGGSGRYNTSTLDDNKTQSATTFLMLLDQQLNQSDDRLHEAVSYALEKLLAIQYPNGAWPQRFVGPPAEEEFPVIVASYPEQWSRTYPKKKYTSYYTLNDNTIADTIGVMLSAYDIYGQRQFAEAARNGGNFFLLAQMPDPQPGWAQQYDRQMHPAWARKFEPASITGGESQQVMRTLLLLYERFGDPRYRQSVEKALAYYRKSLRPDGRLARFYELKTNRPLYFTLDYRLTYDDQSMPTHYSFIVGSKLDSIDRKLQSLLKKPPSSGRGLPERIPYVPPKVSTSKSLAQQAAQAASSLDQRGAWVTAGSMRNYPDAGVSKVIETSEFIRRLIVLARYIGAESPNP